jgi:hypothetical protein
MRRALVWCTVGAALGALGCGEPLGTAAPALVPDQAMRFLRWPAHADGAGFAVARETPSPEPAATTDMPLEGGLSFWAVRGRSHALGIHYVSGATTQPFLQLSLPADALLRRPDGTMFADGDSVLISLTVDSSLVMVTFTPSGLTFNPTSPLTVDVFYGAADLDLDGDGDVDPVDEALRLERLGVWYQEFTGTPWERTAASHDPESRRFAVSLYHFSGYAVSW